MYSCGLRVSEVINLTWADLKPHRRGGKITVFGKGGKTRILVVPPKLWQALCGWQKQSGEDYVFVSRRKKKLDRSAVHRLIKKACKQAGIDVILPKVSTTLIYGRYAYVYIFYNEFCFSIQ